ncbi:MAG: hypothetical protein OXT03_02595 [Alphaproteobacteria bacterium]|nr:hypothetical protein [Alphaproteobacteria bacterium]
MAGKRRNRLDRLVATAEAAQQAARDLDNIFDGLEKRQLNLVQSGLQMSAVWLKAFSDIEKHGQGLAQILNILTRDLGKISVTTPGINGGIGGGINRGISAAISGGINGASQRQAAPYPLPLSAPITPPPIHINLNAPNLASVERAEPQLASVLARAVKRGMRGL